MNFQYTKLVKGMAVLMATNVVMPEVVEAAPVSTEQPNIIFIFSDDHANRTISAYSSDLVQTPNIDRIANEGAIFENTFVGNSICQPSRASVMTGKHSHKNGVTDNTADWNPNQLAFPKLLEQAGYDTALIGKWHMKPTPVNEFGYSIVLSGSGRQGTYYQPEFVDNKGKKTVVEGYSADVITDMSLDWMKQRDDADKPFLLKIQYKAPHTPRRPALRHLTAFKDHVFPEPATLHDDYNTRGDHAQSAWMQLYGMGPVGINAFPPAATTPERKEVRKEWLASMTPRERKRYQEWMSRMNQEQRDAWHAAYDDINVEYWDMQKDPKYKRRRGANLTTEQKADRLSYMYQRFMRDYAATVLGIDENVGRVLDYIDEAGIADNTIVVYSSDQSFFIGEHGWAEKRYMYEEGMKMPFLIRWPGHIKPGQRPEAMIQNIDFAPTFLDSAGVSIPDEIQGKSFKALLEGQVSDEQWQQQRPAVYYHYYMHGAHNVPRHDGVRTDRYKLIDFYSQNNGEGWFEMYDLEADPYEVNNVYQDPKYAEVRTMMHKHLHELRAKYEVPDDVFEVPYVFMNRKERRELGIK
ncbi:sulfatase [Photobacterium lutimaris]|uniref:Mucin-desulfating sulfatase (N-acetylglucosamine-6-sulfatase) n=1 Tax=Photobacterium lutimaris TaxID=388278 RepID=A0A2T3IZ12_9GAMM|nr:sulfatase [Photobacterium lutimaris]PSU33857.1 mucin-desulfating sulfatase (N-acetylglucosamine-6-sulfatase) [Photobacterium lutimaris]TDR76182.1 arylsulfatase A-like enzyme [Photobacterium lutimaris]